MSKPLYEQLCAIADAHPAYLVAYKADLHEHDKRELERNDVEVYVWILRECGTELFPVGQGMNAKWATFWLDNASKSVPPLTYEVNRRTGTVRPISHELARRYAELPHPLSLDRGVWETWPSNATVGQYCRQISGAEV